MLIKRYDVNDFVIYEYTFEENNNIIQKWFKESKETYRNYRQNRADKSSKERDEKERVADVFMGICSEECFRNLYSKKFKEINSGIIVLSDDEKINQKDMIVNYPDGDVRYGEIRSSCILYKNKNSGEMVDEIKDVILDKNKDYHFRKLHVLGLYCNSDYHQSVKYKDFCLRALFPYVSPKHDHTYYDRLSQNKSITCYLVGGATIGLFRKIGERSELSPDGKTVYQKILLKYAYDTEKMFQHILKKDFDLNKE